MELPDDVVTELTRRLSRVEGQLRGIQQMLKDQRDCKDIVTQMSAASRALDQTGFRLIVAGLTWCLSHPDEAAEEGYALDDVQRMFLRLG
jgi:DNA-binding FrmR family transcriptional regulator